MYRLRLTSGQLALFSSVTRSDVLKREMIAATAALPEGTVVRLGGRTLRLGAALGTGLVGTVAEARCLDTGALFALKRARASFRVFQESFRLEVAATEALSRLRALRPARVVEHAPHALLKELLRGETLQRLLLRGALTDAQRASLVEALREAADVSRRLGFLVDLSPKNLCWQDGWVLLDAGPKTHVTDYGALLEDPGWEPYVRYFERKGSLAPGGSAPSVLSRTRSESDVPQAPAHAFVRDWWVWIPYDPHVEKDRFFVTLDETQREDEAIFRVDLERGPELTAAPGADPRLVESELLRACAREAWRRQHPELPALTGGARPLSLLARHEPISLAALATETEPRGLARVLQKATAEREPLQVPDLHIRPYAHWTDLGRPESAHHATDILCHEPLSAPRPLLESLLATRPHFAASVPLSRRDGPFAELRCLPSGNCQRAILFVPGFRASFEAQAPLVEALLERGVEGLFVMTYLGVRTRSGQAQVTGGRWESVLLWDAVDYVTECLGAREAVIVSASHGTIAACLVAELHPRVTGLTLDSSILHPLDLVVRLAESRGESPESAVHALVEQHVPRPFQCQPPTRGDLRLLTMHPRQDRILSTCGELSAGPVLRYEGGHAATMRHDSAERGVPDACLEALVGFLGPARR